MSGVFRNIIPPPLTARRLCTPSPLVRGEDTLGGWRGGGGSIFRKTPDTALYSIYVGTLWCKLNPCLFYSKPTTMLQLGIGQGPPTRHDLG
jgi:hypothetical protein